MCSGYGAIPWTDIYQDIETQMPIYICQIYDEYATRKFITATFKQLNLGDVEFIYFQDRADGIGKQAIIYLQWHYNKSVENLQQKIKNLEQDARVVYDDPNYWIIKKYVLNQSQQNNRFEIFEERLCRLEKISSSMQWNLKLHDANIEYFANKFNQNTDTGPAIPNLYFQQNTAQLYKQNSCCGAASNAWIPSYPSESRDIFK